MKKVSEWKKLDDSYKDECYSNRTKFFNKVNWY